MKRLVMLAVLVMMCIGAGAQSFASLMANASYVRTQYKFKVPDFMNGGNEVYVDDVPADVVTYWYGNVSLSCWPLLGNWATFDSDYPAYDAYLTAKAKVRNVTYTSNNGVYSGYTKDGRIYYMKKIVYDAGITYHARALVLIYPKSLQSSVTPLINIVKNWR